MVLSKTKQALIVGLVGFSTLLGGWAFPFFGTNTPQGLVSNAIVVCGASAIAVYVLKQKKTAD